MAATSCELLLLDTISTFFHYLGSILVPYAGRYRRPGVLSQNHRARIFFQAILESNDERSS